MYRLVRIPDLDTGTKLDSRAFIIWPVVVKVLNVFDVMSPYRNSACTSRFAGVAMAPYSAMTIIWGRTDILVTGVSDNKT